ncbi:class I adenylate-forming enzyme family protein [Rhodococcus pyridinivorans]
MPDSEARNILNAPGAMSRDAYWRGSDEVPVLDLTVGDLLRRAAAAAPGVVALVEGVKDPRERRRWTYAELLEDSERVARALLSRFEPGCRIAVWANNVPEWVMLEFGIGFAGMTLVTVNPGLRAAELSHVLRDSEATAIFLLREYRSVSMQEALETVKGNLTHLREVIYFDQLAEFCSPTGATVPLPRVQASDDAQIQYTSGTTGPPKGAVLHHRGLVNNTILSYGNTFDLQRGEAWVNVMPLFHTAGCVLNTLYPVWAMATHVLVPSWDAELHLELVSSERSVSIGGVPTMLAALLAHPSIETLDFSSLRVALSGGAPVDAGLIERIEQKFGVPMSLVYAQTEASPVITTTALEDATDDRRGTLGRPIPGIDVKIIDPTTGNVVQFDEVGEICTRGFHVMAGYLGGVGAGTIDADGWLHTGDLASMDERGYCKIAGRLKEMIIRGGENLYPWEIEQAILTHPDVEDVVVVGIPDDHWGEVPVAAIRSAADITDNELEIHCAPLLARHKVPRRWVRMAAFPQTPTGKILKRELRESIIQS